jgi:single-stranded-DNA-specific exonuclease
VNTVWEFREDTALEPFPTRTENIDIHTIVLQILLKRGLTNSEDIQKFLYGKIEDEYDPFLLKGMEEAVARVKQAIENNETILVHGDYDVDGVTATALLGKTLDELGIEKYLYLPERLKGGYGVSKKAIYYAREKKAGLIITVDCGISAYEEIALANSFGIDVIVTDHHRPGRDILPPAVAIVNPWRPDCSYPFKELSGVGIAYKLSKALGARAQEDYLDLVAFGTVCDLSVLRDENRILVKYGLKKIDEAKNCGLSALRKVAGVKGRKTNTGHLGFMLGPRVNASGRLGSAECALRLLVTDNAREADSLAIALDEENKERRKLEQIILREAIRNVDRDINFNTDKVIVVWNKNWHLGVIGIVAQRLVEKYNRPAIVISVDKESGACRGSARSIKGFNVFEALQHTSDLLTEYGGHEYAAGIEIPFANLEAFRQKINDFIRLNIEQFTFLKSFTVDAEINFSDIDQSLLNGLELMEPFGRGNPKPLFMAKGVFCKERSIFLSKSTVKLWLTDEQSTYEAIWYKAPSDTKIVKGERLDVIFNLTQRRWYDREVIMLEIKDLRRSA